MTKLSHKTDLGHWSFDKDFSIDDYYGFLYFVENKRSERLYIGRKNFKVDSKRKRSKNHGKEHAWRNYTSSSEHLKKDINLLGKENFKFTIVELYRTRGGLNYCEAWAQMVLEVMTKHLPDGVTPRFYNRQVAAIRWVPKEEPSEKLRKFVRFINRKYK